MSRLGMIRTVLATELCEAIKNDYKNVDADIPSGIFGKETSLFIVDAAKRINELEAEIINLKERINKDLA